MGCLNCVEFCPHEVFGIFVGKPDVRNPEGCVEFCRGCQKICEYGAIRYYPEVKKNG